MKMKEDSTFLQGVESRLDSLFAEDTQPVKAKDSDPPRAAAQEVASDIKEDILKVSDIEEETIQKPEIAVSEPSQGQDKSTFISEIEKRFSAIFGEDEKHVSAPRETEELSDLKNILAQAEPQESKDSDQPMEDLSSPPSSVFNSPLKDMKSIILSIEWEINDDILEQLEEEINKLYLLYTGDRIVQGFLRILRFLGRYVRVRGVHSSQDSINLLLFVYDHLENVMISEGMTESKKHVILIDNIRKYRAWVENTDIESRKETPAPEAAAEEMKPSSRVMELWEDKPFIDERAEIEKLAEVQTVEEPRVEPAIVQPAMEEPFLKEIEPEPMADQVSKEPDMAVAEPQVSVAEMPAPALEGGMENKVAAIKELAPHEAFVYALEEIKKNFQSELDALREEIRILKSAR